MSALVGSMRTCEKYMGRGLVLLVLRQVLPASSERQRPVLPESSGTALGASMVA